MNSKRSPNGFAAISFLRKKLPIFVRVRVWYTMWTISRLICHDFIKCDKKILHRNQNRPCAEQAETHTHTHSFYLMLLFHAFVESSSSDRTVQLNKSIHFSFMSFKQRLHPSDYIYNGCMQLFIQTPNACRSILSCNFPTFQINQRTNPIYSRLKIQMAVQRFSRIVVCNVPFFFFLLSISSCCRGRHRRGWLHFLWVLFEW